jgi:hypothetical protein
MLRIRVINWRQTFEKVLQLRRRRDRTRRMKPNELLKQAFRGPKYLFLNKTRK